MLRLPLLGSTESIELRPSKIIALGLRDSLTIELRLPAELTGHERALLNAVDAIRSLANIQAGQRKIDIQRQCQPTCWAEAPADDGARLVHTPETWCRIVLNVAGATEIDLARPKEKRVQPLTLGGLPLALDHVVTVAVDERRLARGDEARGDHLVARDQRGIDGLRHLGMECGRRQAGREKE